MKTKKEIIQETVEHIKTNGRAIRHDETAFCMYRNPDGIGCAVGKWIPDEVYRPVMQALVLSDRRGTVRHVGLWE